MTIEQVLRDFADRAGVGADAPIDDEDFVDLAHAAIARAALATARESLRQSEPRLAALVRRREVRP